MFLNLSLSCRSWFLYLTMSLLSCSVQAYCPSSNNCGPIGYGSSYGQPAATASAITAPAYGIQKCVIPYYQPQAALPQPTPVTSAGYYAPNYGRYYDPSTSGATTVYNPSYNPSYNPTYATIAPTYSAPSGVYYTPSNTIPYTGTGSDCYTGKPSGVIYTSAPSSYTIAPNTGVSSGYTAQPNYLYYDPTCDPNTAVPSCPNNVVIPSNLYEPCNGYYDNPPVNNQRPSYSSSSSTASYSSNDSPSSSSYSASETDNVNTGTSSSADGTQLSMNTSRISRRSAKNNKK